MPDFPLLLDTAPMEAKLVEDLPSGDGWQFEPKWDGFRCLVFKADKDVDLRAKSGKPLARYFPDVVEHVRAMAGKRFVLDGELIIVQHGEVSFEALQLRLHPAASRVAKLARETAAQLLLFDCLHNGRRSLLRAPLAERRAALDKLYRSTPGVRLSPFTRDVKVARGWLKRAGRAMDGVVAKRLAVSYIQGERAMLKVKRLRTADCVVGGFRYLQGARQVGSLLLVLYDDDGLLHHVGFTSTISNAERAALTKRLERLAGGPGFTGSAPGAPSRWSGARSTEWTPLKPKLVVEVRYDHVSDGRFRHGTKLVRWRPDKAPRQCTMEQLAPPAPPAELRAILKASR